MKLNDIDWLRKEVLILNNFRSEIDGFVTGSPESAISKEASEYILGLILYSKEKSLLEDK